MWLSGISCQSVWGVIFQWGSTLKVSIELPATSRHRRDMTERLLKATLSPNQSNQMWLVESPCRGIGSWLLCFLAYLSTKCSWWAIVVSQCPSCVVRRAASTIALKAYFSYTPRPMTRYLVRSIGVTCRLKIAKIVSIGNPRWPPSWKSIFRFFSWTERPIDSKLGRKHWSGL